MSDLLSIGSSGVTAYQRALATVSNNIANVSTDGYTRQDVSLVANQPAQAPAGPAGRPAAPRTRDTHLFPDTKLPFGALQTTNADITARVNALQFGDAVYKAIDTQLNRYVAVKIIRKKFAGDPHFIETFAREARSDAAVNHPYVAQAEWGGYKQSGVGRELGEAGFAEYLEHKHIWHNLAPAPSDWFPEGPTS